MEERGGQKTLNSRSDGKKGNRESKINKNSGPSEDGGEKESARGEEKAWWLKNGVKTKKLSPCGRCSSEPGTSAR